MSFQRASMDSHWNPKPVPPFFSVRAVALLATVPFYFSSRDERILEKVVLAISM